MMASNVLRALAAAAEEVARLDDTGDPDVFVGVEIVIRPPTRSGRVRVSLLAWNGADWRERKITLSTRGRTSPRGGRSHV